MEAKSTEKAPVSIRRAITYKSEYMDTLNRLWKENRRLSGFKYYLDTVYRWMNEDRRREEKPSVVVLGPGVPEELILAAGVRPYWLLGGSLGSVSWSDDLVPRDTDPVSRSVLGYIHEPDGVDFSDALFIIPLTSDSMRKIAYQLKDEGRKLCLVDFPPDREDRRAMERWQDQMLAMTAAVAAHAKTRVTRRTAASAAKLVSRARAALRSFLDASRGREDLVTGAARLLVTHSYYCAEDLAEWAIRTEELTDEVRRLTKRLARTTVSHPGILLMGSPVYFPNYKIPFLVQEIGLDILDTADPASAKLGLIADRRLLRGSRDRIIRSIADAWYTADTSSAFVTNDALYRQVSRLLEQGDIEGVVCHVLKGQIEYDFELTRFEELFAEHGIPVFRLETDYQYQDVEQLRIRMEAFSEMLTQNRYREVKKAQ